MSQNLISIPSSIYSLSYQIISFLAQIHSENSINSYHHHYSIEISSFELF